MHRKVQAVLMLDEAFFLLEDMHLQVHAPQVFRAQHLGSGLVGRAAERVGTSRCICAPAPQ